MKFVYYLILLFSCGSASAQLTARIDVLQKSPDISDKLFGMFMENLGNEDVGNLSDDCLWAELIDDRKFFYPIDNSEVLVPKNRKEAINRWRPIGKVEMNASDAFVGKHSPKITTTSAGHSGISQSGIALVKGKKYIGHIWVNASAGVSVSVQITEGGKTHERSVVKASEYTKFDFEFTAESNAKADLKILGKGDGNFHIGAVSLMPADNIDGFRPDVIKLLKDLHSAPAVLGRM